MDKKQAIRRKVFNQLDQHGWRRIAAARLPHRLEIEVWTLESTWTPRGLPAHVLFCTNTNDRGRMTVHVSGPQPDESWSPYPDDYGWWYWRRPLESAAVFEELDRWREDGTGAPAEELSVCEAVERRLKSLRCTLGDRKLRLFACACLRRMEYTIADERNLFAVEMAEQYADGLVRKREMKKARKTARLPWLTSFEPYHEAVSTIHRAALVMPVEQQSCLSEILDDLAGPLPRPAPLRPCWLQRNGGIVSRMAQVIHADRTFSDLPILADALEEAGCDRTDILSHCRGGGAHARGCWILDLLLGKE
jgi:hypothetical protein